MKMGMALLVTTLGLWGCGGGGGAATTDGGAGQDGALTDGGSSDARMADSSVLQPDASGCGTGRIFTDGHLRLKYSDSQTINKVGVVVTPSSCPSRTFTTGANERWNGELDAQGPPFYLRAEKRG